MRPYPIKVRRIVMRSVKARMTSVSCSLIPLKSTSSSSRFPQMSWPPPENDNDSKEVKVRNGKFLAEILTSTVSCSCVSPNTSPSSNIEANRIIQNLKIINTEVSKNYGVAKPRLNVYNLFCIAMPNHESKTKK